jgi:hypothetical protein
MFPDGLTAFQQKLGLPLVLHNRWFAPTNSYRDRYSFFEDREMSLPLEQGPYDEFMADARSWGAITYEQDWLIPQFWGVSHLRSGVDRAATWMKSIDAAAAARGLTVQITMPGAANVLHAVDLPTVTSARTSIDYAAAVSKESFWPQFHIANMVADAAGVPPFKDNFHSSELYGEAEALISVLSSGMVGPGDAIGAARPEIIGRTCRKDGVLLKPDRPARPLDAMFLPHERPFTTVTTSERPGLGTWTYLAAYHLSSAHPERAFKDNVFATIAYDGQPLEDQFVFPELVSDWRLELGAELGIDERVVVYDWRNGSAFLAKGRIELPPVEHLYDFVYLVLAPVLKNGLALIGETDKFVTLADRRFRDIRVTSDGIELELSGNAGESVTLAAFDTRTGRLLDPVTATLDAAGQASARIDR